MVALCPTLMMALFSLYDSRIRRLIKFLCTAFLNFFRGTEIKTWCLDAGLGLTMYKIVNGWNEKEEPLLKSSSINFLLDNLSSFGNRNLALSEGMEHDQVYFLLPLSSETDNFFLPLALLRVITAFPPGVSILDLYPCLFVLFFLEGWNVRFIVLRFNNSN